MTDWQVESYELSIRRRDVDPNVTEITSADTCERWLVIRRMLDASSISLQVTTACCICSTLMSSVLVVFAVCNGTDTFYGAAAPAADVLDAVTDFRKRF